MKHNVCIAYMYVRTFSWLENNRRLTIDYEFLTETAEAMVGIAFIQIARNRFFNHFKTVSENVRILLFIDDFL